MNSNILLNENIIGLYQPRNIIGNTYNIFDAYAYSKNLSSENKNTLKANKEYTKNASQSYALAYNREEDIHVNLSLDFTKYEAYSFWIYAKDKAAIGKELRLTFVSPATEEFPLNFYNLKIKIINTGWNYFSGKICFGHNPVYKPSWKNIIQFNIHHNDKECKEDITLYLDNFTLHENEDSIYSGNHMAVLDNAVAFCVNGARGIYNDHHYEIDKDNPKAKVFKENETYWLPLGVFAAYNDASSTYNHISKELCMSYKNNKYKFVGGENKVEINDENYTLNFTIREKAGAIFIPHTYAMQLFDLPNIYTNKFGIIILSKEKCSYDMVNDLDILLDIGYTCLFERPSKEKMVSDIKSNLGSLEVHPRLYLNQKDFERLKGYLASDKKYQEYFEEMMILFGENSDNYKDSPIDFDSISKQRNLASLLLLRVASWSMFYKLTNKTQYAERAWLEIESICNFPNWIDKHYLTTAEICVSAATVYDWLYDYLTTDRRKKLESSLYEKGLLKGLDIYEGRAQMWPRTNWNGICNSGTVVGAMALLNIYPDICTKILGYGLSDIEKSLYTFAPDAAHSESAMYWEFHVKYYHMFLAALESTCGTDYGLLSSPCFLDSSYFPYYIQSEIGSWPYHDSLGDIVINNYSYWFANKKSDAFLAKLRDEQISRAKEIRINPPKKPTDDIGLSVCFYDLMWYRPFNSKNAKKDMPLDSYYRLIDIITMRSNWEKGANFIGLHGGDNSADHGDLDTGNFILYAKGHKFFDDFGKENYDVPGYFSWPGGTRYSYYRKRAEGHNTITIGECDRYKFDQEYHTCSRFTQIASNEHSALAILDMKDAYRNYSPLYVNRGILFIDNRSTIIIQDELKLKEKNQIRWQAHTLKEFNTKISNDGLTAILNAGDCKLYCEIVLPKHLKEENTNVHFTILPAQSLDKAYVNNELEWSRDKYEKLMIISDDTDILEIAVIFKVLDNDEKCPEKGALYTFKHLSDWKI